MIGFENIRLSVVKGLSDYLSCKVIRKNQDAPIPPHPYCAYNITTPTSQNKGTYGIDEDGIARKSSVLTLSFSSHSEDYEEALTLASKAHEWIDYAGTVLLNDNDIIIQSVGNITDRSNLLTVGYEYSFGFDCFISVTVEIGAEQINEGEIKTATIGEQTIENASAFESIVEALINNGVNVPEDTDTMEYGALINQACQSQYNKGYNQGFNDNSPDSVVTQLEAMIDESGVLA